MEIETKYSRLEADAVADDGTISGYASRFGEKDMGGDIVLPGAYTKSLADRHPLMLWSHDLHQPIGKWTKVAEDATGLRVEGKLMLTSGKGREVYDLLKMGAINGMSIGYKAIRTGREGAARLLKEVALFEISITPLPLLASATIDAVKGFDDAYLAAKSGDYAALKRAVEGALRDAGFPAWMAKAQAALAPQALGDGSRDASASEIAKLIKNSFGI
ncbi:HK97 family phage prohead protease [Pararhizobium gei]|uniref:HK97 family phage prohead protease n=1 Tax=Pararhizobium gei TaxID=1395951 RepID=UPI0023DCE2E2|nr:HK97 family phage prohead protease [Rhizobium gei]